MFTSGCFDVLHTGHLKLLNEAKAMGDVLIVGINSDESVKRLKGPGRPINSEMERVYFMQNLAMVDWVCIFDEDTPCEIISKLKPDIHVKGGDYDPNDYTSMPESKVVHDYGGEVRIVSLVSGKSSSNIIEKKKERE